MTVGDLVAAELIVANTYGSIVPGDGHRAPAWLERWRVRTGHLLGIDPDGCWSAVLGGEVVGFAVSFRREATWFLSSYAVRLDLQGQGIGRLLMEAAEKYGADCPRAMLSASADPRAEARYRAAGFTLMPQWRFTGIPQVDPVDASSGAPDLDALDREVRGSAHGPDHTILGRQFALIVEPNGYAYLDADGSPALLCARDTTTASRLLRRALAAAPPGTPVTVGHVTAANQWAHELAESAGLVAVPSGTLALRGMDPPFPYLHHGALL